MEPYQYQIPRPSLPFVARLLASLLVIGLIGLGTAAYAAFSYIGHWWQALAFALVVELCGIIEALAIMRGNRFAIPGLAISLAVSTSYNWTQAEQAAALLPTPLAWWQLAALAIGPMSAVFFVALSLGHEIRAHEAAVATWAAQRQAWLDDQAERAARREERREQRQERIALEREQWGNSSRNGAGTGANVLPAVPPTKGTYQEYVALMQSNGANHTRRELAERFGVTERAITKWAARYREEHTEPAAEASYAPQN